MASTATLSTVSSAISNVLPLRAVLQFDNAEGFGEWRIYISTRANRDLRDARCRDPKLFTIIVKKIKELSNGHFSDDNQKRLNHSAAEVPIFEAKMTRDTRLVYQVDCVPEDENRECQTLKVFGIYTHAQLDKRLWSSLGNHLARKGKEYRRRVTYRTRPLVNRDNVYFPASFPPVDREEPEDASQLPTLPKEDLEELHSLLVLEKFVPFSHTLLSCILADLDVSYVPKLSVEEEEIVHHSQSCYVLGRSGTGKTATMMWKMFGIERAYHQMSEAFRRPRQVFVTQSRSLAIRVEESFLKLTKALTTYGKTNKELVQIAKDAKETHEEEGLVDQDEEEEYRSTLPTKFSELKDEHFPLFITFDKLCRLLEADVLGEERVPLVVTVSDGKDSKGPVLITYDVFLAKYWPHLPQNLTKGLDPSLVFSEIMGVIKGSEEACRSEERYLSRDAYENLSVRMQATFATQRPRIYDLFEQYLRHKRLSGDFDSADRTHKLLTAFRKRIPLAHGERLALGQWFDYLYVDEVQDNLLIDALLMRLLCRNPTGLFWAGDTAQTISVGSSFRFNDLKSFLYRVEEESFRDDPGMIARSGEPVTFQLTTNYRSHSGILNCAHTVIELIVKFWPYSIDVLKPGKGLVDGIKPVFFRGWDQSNVRYEQFLFKASSGNYIEFGAKQCILVRNEVAREKLREHVGDIGLIMTLYEAKGLEFDDVLLFDFFEDSTVDLSQWRVVLNLIPPNDRNSLSTPRFEETQHAGVNSELKFLYVAITRARKNMWIVDRSGRGEPMRLLWASRSQIENCTPETGVDLAVSSSAEEWSETARALFERKQFFHAMKCYEKAGLTREAMISEAYHLRHLARQLPKSTRKGEIALRVAAFRKAAKAFLGCVEATKKVSDRLAYYRNAAEAYEHAEDFKVAAKTYVLAEEFGTAGSLYRQHGFFDEAVDVVKRYRSRMAEDVAESIVLVARLYYFKENKLQAANDLFDSVEEELEFCEDYDLDVAKASLLEAKGDLAGAAQLHMDEGRIMEAISLLLKDMDSETSQAKAAECILDGFWGLGLFGISAEKFTNDNRVKKLLAMVKRVNVQKLASDQQQELEMFKAIFENEKSHLERLGMTLYKNRHHAALLCLDQRFTHFPSIQVMNAVEITPVLELFATYTCLLSDITSKSEACSLPEVQKLFNFKMTTQNVFLLTPGTFLHSAVMNGRTRIISSSEEGLSVAYADLLLCLQSSLKLRMRTRILAENAACFAAQAFSAPCLTHTILGSCTRTDCRRPHIQKGDLTPERYNAQIRIYLQQFLILRSLPFLGEEDEQQIKRREWMDRFFQALYPPYHTFGSVSCLRASSIPEARRGIQVLKYWSQDTLEKAAVSTNPRTQFFFLTRVTRAANIALTFNEDGQTSYVYHSKAATVCGSNQVYRRVLPNGMTRNIFVDYLCALQVKERTSIICGFNFVKHIVSTKIPFDVSMLCDMVDLTCAALIVAKSPTPFQNLTMPRSWFLMLFPKLDPSKRVDSVIPPLEMISLIGELLNVVHAGLGDTLSFEGHNLQFYTGVRNVLVARLCRAICFLGYNERCAGAHRQKIIGILNKLRTGDHRIRVHTIFAKYADARHWGEIVRMIQTPGADSLMDQIITLNSSGVAREKPGHTTLVCHDIKQIPVLLGQPAPFTSKLRADAPAFVPNFVPPTNPLTAASTESKPEEDEVEEQDDDGAVAVEDDPQIIEVPKEEEEVEEFRFRPRTEEEIAAVVKIQQAYRQARRRRQPSSSARVEACRRFFKDAQAEASSIQWKANRYRFLFLGAIPHAMVCLDTIDGWAKGQKAKNKKKFTKGGHEDLETTAKALTEIVQFLKTTKELKPKLEPKSQLHKGRDIVHLKNHVRELEDLFSRVNAAYPGVLNEVNDDLLVVVQSVLVGPVKSVEGPKVKPTLNTEDLD